MKKIKLPRKRKKQYIASRGRNNYLAMPAFLEAEGSNIFARDVCMSLNEHGETIFTAVGRW